MIRIERRKGVWWLKGFLPMVIPAAVYTIGKIAGVTYNNLEFLNWVLIGIFAVAYFVTQFKVSFQRKEVPACRQCQLLEICTLRNWYGNECSLLPKSMEVKHEQ